MDRDDILIYPLEREGEALPIIREAIFFNTDYYRKVKAEMKTAESVQLRSCNYDE